MIECKKAFAIVKSEPKISFQNTLSEEGKKAATEFISEILSEQTKPPFYKPHQLSRQMFPGTA